MKTIILTGGTSKRFGSDKSEALINSKTLLEYLTEGLSNLVIVGPKTKIDAFYVREEPIGAGPVAAIGAGLNVVDSDLVSIFATDMPFAPRIVPQLLNSLVNDAAIPMDCDGYVQPLAGVYRTEKLRRALEEFESLENRSVKDLISKLNIDRVPLVETEFLLDIDTKEDLAKAIDLASRLAL
jgi:molybdopterin-guanine dinucleotide biosynthesis protein A